MKRKERAAPPVTPRAGRARRAPAGSARLAPPTESLLARWHPRHWRINWRRGLIRLWLLGSFLWAGYWLYKLQLACAFWFAPWCAAPTHVDWPNDSMALGLALVLLSGPVLALLLGLGTIWAVRGFLARRAP